MNEIIQEVCNIVKKQTKKEEISFTAYKKKTSIFNSKLRGIPYKPKDSANPKWNNIELSFLAQINFEEIPQLKGFPNKGILQFFILDNEDMLWGASGDKAYKILYYENVDYSLNEKELERSYSDNFPVKEEYALEGQLSSSYISVNDYRFNNIFMECYKKFNDTSVEGYWEIEGIKEDEINEIFSCKNIKCGGNPAFIQDDIRQYKKELVESILLFEIPTIVDKDVGILWGDSGIANFFINKEDFIDKDFSNITFYWDSY